MRAQHLTHRMIFDGDVEKFADMGLSSKKQRTRPPDSTKRCASAPRIGPELALREQGITRYQNASPRSPSQRDP